MNVCAILLAAGAARRMRGADKLTESVRGKPLLRDRALMLLDTRVTGLVVVLPDTHPEREIALDGLEVIRAVNLQAASGMASSIQTGLCALPQTCEAALIMPSDLPDLTSADIDLMVTAYICDPTHIHRGTSEAGQPGSPVIFPRRFFAELQALSGDESGRAVVTRHHDQVRMHALPETHATLDLDTPEAWVDWRKRPL